MQKTFWLIIVFLFVLQAEAQNFQSVKDGPVHEAYVSREYGSLVLEMVPTQPPPNIVELIPTQSDSQAIWIPGYWGWSKSRGQYLWVSGIWRRPPPGFRWILGHWKQYADGWVWLHGMWSNVEEKELKYIPTPPPDPLNEYIPPPPSSVYDYFWIQGDWKYDFQKQQYIWYSGRWDIVHPHWTYVPARFFWREEGFLATCAFWDWPLEIRGVPFTAIAVEPTAIDALVYEPSNVLSHFEVLTQIFPSWPDYIFLFQNEFYFHRETWLAWGAVPPWWEWPDWWSLTWPEAWWLWWWWTHPGYPNPPWITASVAHIITAPPSFLLKLIQSAMPPPNVTPNGVIDLRSFLQALETFTGKDLPILPSDPKQVRQIQHMALPHAPKQPYLFPEGKEKVKTPPEKPLLGSKLEAPTIVLPPLPILAPGVPVINDPPKSQTSQMPLFPPNVSNQPQTNEIMPPMDTTPPIPGLPEEPRPYFGTPRAPMTPLPTYTPQLNPQPNAMPTFPPARPIPQPRGPQRYLPLPEVLEPTTLPPAYAPEFPSRLAPDGTLQSPPSIYEMQAFPSPYESPIQGVSPYYSRHQRTPMETEHHDLFMSHPMPQVNPEGPSVYETPGDYSTLPGE
jgi:hypothetical protein